jgi:hypothetical protein
MKTSPTKRTLDKLRSEGFQLVEVTERWNPFAKVRKDLFGFVDVLGVRDNFVIAVQTTSGANVSARFEKMRLLPSVTHWLLSPYRKVVIHGWAQRGAKGKRKLWTCREVEIVLGPTGSPVIKEGV